MLCVCLCGGCGWWRLRARVDLDGRHGRGAVSGTEWSKTRAPCALIASKEKDHTAAADLSTPHGRLLKHGRHIAQRRVARRARLQGHLCCNIERHGLSMGSLSCQASGVLRLLRMATALRSVARCTVGKISRNTPSTAVQAPCKRPATALPNAATAATFSSRLAAKPLQTSSLRALAKHSHCKIPRSARVQNITSPRHCAQDCATVLKTVPRHQREGGRARRK